MCNWDDRNIGGELPEAGVVGEEGVSCGGVGGAVGEEGIDLGGAFAAGDDGFCFAVGDTGGIHGFHLFGEAGDELSLFFDTKDEGQCGQNAFAAG